MNKFTTQKIDMNWMNESWPWYVSGLAIALVMFLLLMMGRRFGMSSNLRTLCSICGAGKKASFFDYDWKAQKWNLIVVAGVILGGFFASQFMQGGTEVDLHPEVIEELQNFGFTDAGAAYMPSKIYGAENLRDWKSLLILIIGGLLVGFGTRYAGGCTSGHAISGLSSLQLPSLIAVLGFFTGGLLMIHVIFPLIF